MTATTAQPPTAPVPASAETFGRRGATDSPAAPDRLVREVIDGIRFYYKGYKNVLEGKKTIHEVMGSSGIQSLIVTYLTGFLFSNINRRRYWLFTNEVGGHLETGNNPAFDFAIYDKNVVQPADINFRYLQFAPLVAIEVDTDVETEENLSEQEYIYRKTANLFQHGTQKVIWVFTRTQQVTVINTLEDWTTHPWHTPIEVLDGISFNIGQYLDEEGVDVRAAL